MGWGTVYHVDGILSGVGAGLCGGVADEGYGGVEEKYKEWELYDKDPFFAEIVQFTIISSHKS